MTTPSAEEEETTCAIATATAIVLTAATVAHLTTAPDHLTMDQATALALAPARRTTVLAQQATALPVMAQPATEAVMAVAAIMARPTMAAVALPAIGIETEKTMKEVSLTVQVTK